MMQITSKLWVSRLVAVSAIVSSAISALAMSLPAQAQSVQPAAKAKAKLTTLHHFKAGRDGHQPVAGLTSDGAGGFYGTTEFGGKDEGLVFQLTPPASPEEKRWSISYPYKFRDAPDGNVPNATLIAGPGGVLYGITFRGGTADKGSVFSLTPPIAPATKWKRTILHAFQGAPTDAERPQAQLFLTDDGALLGTTYLGGTADSGTVFLLTPPVSGNQWTFKLVHSFDGTLGGAFPQAGLILDDKGLYYGTTTRGGTNDRGTIYSLRPPKSDRPAAVWKHEVLYSFEAGQTATTGGLPIGNLLLGPKGELYGTTEQGGGAGLGTAFKLAREGKPRTWQYHELHSFGAVAGDGFSPQAGLISDIGGALYGTTTSGGASNHGTIVKLTPPVRAKDPWSEAVLHSFSGADGDQPAASLIFDEDGNLYGTASSGGKFNRGTAFMLRP
jgi:uncharacterized repeat protein (TIGR03803 family)